MCQKDCVMFLDRLFMVNFYVFSFEMFYFDVNDDLKYMA